MKKKTMHKETLTDKIKGLMHMSMHPHKKKLVFEGIAISLPLAVTFVWYSFLIVSSTSISGAEARFAPSRIEALVLFILLFIVAYSIFLVYEIRHLKKRWDKIK